MIAALLLVAAMPRTAVEAGRAFAADAQALGQWTAFRKWAAADAKYPADEPPFDDGELQDGSITWSWVVARNGARTVKVATWEGDNWGIAVSDVIPTPAPKP